MNLEEILNFKIINPNFVTHSNKNQYLITQKNQLYVFRYGNINDTNILKERIILNKFHSNKYFPNLITYGNIEDLTYNIIEFSGNPIKDYKKKDIIIFGEITSQIHLNKTMKSGYLNENLNITLNPKIPFKREYEDYFDELIETSQIYVNYIKMRSPKLTNILDSILIKMKSYYFYSIKNNCFIHKDIQLKNFVKSDSNIKIIDFDSFSAGNPLYDIHFFLFHLYEKDKTIFCQDYLNGYRKYNNIPSDFNETASFHKLFFLLLKTTCKFKRNNILNESTSERYKNLLINGLNNHNYEKFVEALKI